MLKRRSNWWIRSIWIRSNWWCPAGVKSILINEIVIYNLRLISYMPDKLVAILFYWSLNAKSSKFLLSSPVCDFQPKHGLKQLKIITVAKLEILQTLLCIKNNTITVTFYINGCGQFQSLKIWKRLILNKNASASSSFSTFSPPSSLLLPTYFIKLLPLPQKLTASSFRFHIPDYKYSSSSNCNSITISVTITKKRFSKHCDRFTHIPSLEFCLSQ